MIELKSVSKWYGNFQVLTDCTTSIKQGEVVVICGPSGSGKSTLIKTMNALEPFQSGEIIVDGVSLSDPKTNLVQLRARVGMVFQHFELFPHLSVTENLTLAQIKVLGRSPTPSWAPHEPCRSAASAPTKRTLGLKPQPTQHTPVGRRLQP
jgi:glutamate/aspartate transport system ATP-binding protein